MPWLVAAAVAAGLVLTVTAAGAAVLAAAGLRRGTLGAAPAVGTGAIALAAVGASALGARWGLLAALVGTAAACALAGAVHRVVRARTASGPVASSTSFPTTPPDPQAPPRGTTAAAVVVGSLLALVPLAVGAGRPDRVQNAWDALFHLAAVELLRDGGDVRAVHLLADPSGQVTYPFAWHVLTALVPRGVDLLTTVGAAALVPAVVLGTAGTAALARAVLPGGRWSGPVAALLCGAALAAPVSAAVQPGLVANAYALALVPGVLAQVVRAQRVDPRAVVPAVLAVAGVGTSHPGAFLGLALLASPWVVTRVLRWALAPGLATTAGRRRLAVLTLTVAVLTVGGAAVLGGSTTATVVSSVSSGNRVGLGEVTRRLVTGDVGQWPAHPVVLVALAAVGAGALLVRRRGRALVTAGVLTVVVYVGTAAQVPVLTSLTVLWYSEPRRVAPFLGLVVTVLAAHGLLVTAGWVGAWTRRLPRGAGAAVPAVAAAALLTAAVVPGVRAVHDLTADTFAQDVPPDPGPSTRVPYLTVDEEAMVGRLADVLGPDDVVLGDSFAGAGHLAVLTGARAVQPYHTTALPPDARYVGEHLADLGRDPAVCEAVRRLGATHVHVDPYPLRSTYWRGSRETVFGTPPPADVAPAVDRGGTASVHALDVCRTPDAR